MVKCAECGFLAMRHSQTRQLMDAEEKLRTRGYIDSLSISSHDLVYDKYPVCYALKLDFRSEIGGNSDESTRTKAVQCERNCDGYTPWQIGFTPKEHKEMIQEAERRRWQEQRDEADRNDRIERERRQADDARERDQRRLEADRERDKSQADRDAANRKFQEEQAQLNRNHQDRTFQLQAIGLGLAIGSAIGSSLLWFLGGSDKPQPPVPVNVKVEYPAASAPNPVPTETATRR